MSETGFAHGGDHVAEVLKARGVRFVFCLAGGHISPILVGSKARGLRIIDVRHEVNAVFAADAVARMTGVPGVAAVTAGPGLTNTITALKNAQLAQSPLVLLGGAAPTVLQGRGALQDIDQVALIAPHVKAVFRARRVGDLAPMVEQAFDLALDGLKGPVFVECPIDLLYPSSLIREWYLAGSGGGSLLDKAQALYLKAHVRRITSGSGAPKLAGPSPAPSAPIDTWTLKAAARKLSSAERPIFLIGSQTLTDPSQAEAIRAAIEKLGAPVYLSGMARGLLGQKHPLLIRHKRKEALKEADLVFLFGVPSDFRLDYGRHIRRGTTLLSANLSDDDRMKNRRPTLGFAADPGAVLRQLAARTGAQTAWSGWIDRLHGRDHAREADIDKMAALASEGINPVALCQQISAAIEPSGVIVADGGDFVGTAAYTVNPGSALSWLDPGVFGTLGVGGGFALGAKLVRPESDVWILWGDGSAGYSLAEFDTFVRHGLPVIAVVGNDACWTQIARDQLELLKDDVSVMLRHTEYHVVAQGYGGKGLYVESLDQVGPALAEAKRLARAGTPVLVNAKMGKTEFRKGSISM